MFRFTTLTIFGLAATFVAAQTPVPSGTMSTCIYDCILAGAHAAGCISATDYSCFCTSAVFQTALVMCFQQNCPDQVALATGVQQALCIAVSGATSGTPGTSTPNTSTPSTSAPSTSRPSTTTPPSSGTGTPTSGAASSSRSGAAFKNAPVAGAMGALAALIGAAIF